ncbi:MAG: hypothetical protein HXX09_06335 [Bacteroidetes bacterium]|nr:hypothetical protein [Bacteroidota bacterium]
MKSFLQIKTLTFLIFCMGSWYANSQSPKPVLIFGDSYLKGHFGEFLQKKMHEVGTYDILSIAIGGAGSKTFTIPMKNLCCGYRIRQSFAGKPLIETKSVWGSKVPVIEGAEAVTNGLVMKSQEGSLENVLNFWKPQAVILVLGANFINAHEDLLKIIFAYKDSIPLIWIGPFEKNTSAGRYALINKVIKNKPNCFLVRSDDIVEKMGIPASHFFGTTAKNLAETIFEKFRPFLETELQNMDKKAVSANKSISTNLWLQVIKIN